MLVLSHLLASGLAWAAVAWAGMGWVPARSAFAMFTTARSAGSGQRRLLFQWKKRGWSCFGLGYHLWDATWKIGLLLKWPHSHMPCSWEAQPKETTHLVLEDCHLEKARPLAMHPQNRCTLPQWRFGGILIEPQNVCPKTLQRLRLRCQFLPGRNSKSLAPPKANTKVHVVPGYWRPGLNMTEWLSLDSC